MLILDIFVIYLACGAPFAVAAFLKPETRSGLHHVLTSFGSLVYWPLLLPSLIPRTREAGVSKMNSRNDSGVDSTEALLRAALVDHWLTAFGTVDLVAFRDSLERYSALSRELQAGQVPAAENELSSIAGHPDPELSQICQVRRNRRKLELHRTYARSEFIESVDRLVLARQLEAPSVARKLSQAVGDDEALAELEIFSSGLERSVAAVG